MNQKVDMNQKNPVIIRGQLYHAILLFLFIKKIIRP